TRIDFGLALGDTMKTPKRLIQTGGYEKKDRITHRFEITSLKDIDDEVKRWLKIAYERDAGCRQHPLNSGQASEDQNSGPPHLTALTLWLRAFSALLHSNIKPAASPCLR